MNEGALTQNCFYSHVGVEVGATSGRYGKSFRAFQAVNYSHFHAVSMGIFIEMALSPNWSRICKQWPISTHANALC